MTDLESTVDRVHEFINKRCSNLPDAEAQVIGTKLKELMATHPAMGQLVDSDFTAVLELTLFCYAFGVFRTEQLQQLSSLGEELSGIDRALATLNNISGGGD